MVTCTYCFLCGLISLDVLLSIEIFLIGLCLRVWALVCYARMLGCSWLFLSLSSRFFVCWPALPFPLFFVSLLLFLSLSLSLSLSLRASYQPKLASASVSKSSDCESQSEAVLRELRETFLVRLCIYV